jgi:hypothetical protein
MKMNKPASLDLTRITPGVVFIGWMITAGVADIGRALGEIFLRDGFGP